MPESGAWVLGVGTWSGMIHCRLAYFKAQARTRANAMQPQREQFRMLRRRCPALQNPLAAWQSNKALQDGRGPASLAVSLCYARHCVAAQDYHVIMQAINSQQQQ